MYNCEALSEIMWPAMHHLKTSSGSHTETVQLCWIPELCWGVNS